MTIDRLTLKREPVRHLPIFAGLSLAARAEVISVGIKRRSGESISSAVTAAAALVASALHATFPSVPHVLLVAIGRPIYQTGRLAALRADRAKLWKELEDRGSKLPKGTRTEKRVSYGGKAFGYIGSIRTSLAEMGATIELTRTSSALCIAGFSNPEFFDAAKVSNPSPVRERSELLRSAIKAMGEDSFIVRGFGWFDDREVGVDVFIDAANAEFMHARLMSNLRWDSRWLLFAAGGCCLLHMSSWQLLHASMARCLS